MVIQHIQVNKAQKQRRRTYRAHGRINRELPTYTIEQMRSWLQSCALMHVRLLALCTIMPRRSWHVKQQLGCSPIA